jgi:cytochrome c biogenesis protein CcmG, thiol:disulfide interchange protein DsbE
VTEPRAIERGRLGRRSLASLLLGAGVTLSGCAGAGGAGPGASTGGVSHPLVGAPAPGFELAEVAGGGDQSLEAYAGKVVIVDFWATWCEPCKQSFPAYQKLADEMGGELVVIGVSQDDDAKGIAAFRSETGAKFPIVWDDGKALAESYDPPTMPTAFVVDRSGIVRFVHAGYRAGDEATLEEEVRQLMR